MRISDWSSDVCSSDLRLRDAKQNEYHLTKSLVDNLEGYPESIRFLRKNAGWAKKAPLFSDILFCREDYRIAVENYLEPFMNYYVVETFREAMQAISLLSDASRSEEHTSELQSLMRLSYAVFCLKKKKYKQ